MTAVVQICTTFSLGTNSHHHAGVILVQIRSTKLKTKIEKQFNSKVEFNAMESHETIMLIYTKVCITLHTVSFWPRRTCWNLATGPSFLGNSWPVPSVVQANIHSRKQSSTFLLRSSIQFFLKLTSSSSLFQTCSAICKAIRDFKFEIEK